MSIICPNCKYDQNPPGGEFCESCGEFLATDTTNDALSITPAVEVSASTTPITSGTLEPVSTFPLPDPPTTINTESLLNGPSPNRLISVQDAAPINEFIFTDDCLLIGRFDPDTGPVDVDLDEFQGADTVSRHHAELYKESGQWKIRDLGSTNGVFIRKQGERRFSSRLLSPESIYSGDEIAIGKVRLKVES